MYGPLALKGFISIKDKVLKQNWSTASSRLGGLFLIYAEASDLLTKVDEFKREFGNKSSFENLSSAQKKKMELLLLRVIAHLEAQLQAPATSSGHTAISRCFTDGDPENIDLSNRPFPALCGEYDRFNKKLVQMKFYWQNVLDAEAVPPIENFKKLFEKKYCTNLRENIILDPQYKTLFEYVFPMDRLHSLISLYCIEHVSALPGRKEMFADTKKIIERLFYATLATKADDWWRKDKKYDRPDHWTDNAPPLPPWLIVILTPLKILQALLILVPPLKWLLGLTDDIDEFFKDLIPPYQKKKGPDKDPCR